MEATSARMAQRYQFDGFPPPKSPLQRYIYNACDPVNNFEPNLALNLEIVDMINSKKGSAPREAAVTIVQIINHRNPNVSLLALALLDICVKNCGYPFHLQISTKEFLNELVRRFPERPPLRPSRVQMRILESIEEWRQTICQTSKYKEDLGFIRDMHRLLLYKGYMFPEVRREDAAVLNSQDDLKSAEEMEEEEKAAQSAKLQELIRRGTPQDLQEANRLMKVMAGYDTRHKTDYRAKAAEEVAKVQQKAKILEEMLQNHKEGDKIEDGDVFEELAAALQSAHPKIQRMCEEESDDAEAVAKLLEINDSIHRTIRRYKLMKEGNITAANDIPKGTLGTTTGVSKNAANELSLIDFDAEAPAPSATTSMPQNSGLLDDNLSSTSNAQTTVADDLLGLNLGDSSAPGTGSISLGGATLSHLYAQSPGPSQTFSPPPQSQPFVSSQAPPSTKPNYNALSGLNSPTSTSKPATPVPNQQKTSQSIQAVDPFAALISSGSRPSTPQQQNGTRTTPSTQQTSNLSTASGNVASKTPATSNDDEWTFASSLPQTAEATLPSTATLQVHTSPNLRIEFSSQRRNPQDTNSILIAANFSNPSTHPIAQLHFQVAVEKAYTLQLKPQTGRDLAPGSTNAIKQEMLLSNIPIGKGNEVKIRFKVGFAVNGLPSEENGMVTGLGIA